MSTSKTPRSNSQCGKILKYLQDGNMLTVEIARMLGFGANARSRISDLENAGHKIKHGKMTFSGGYCATYKMMGV